jgi:serine/threonine protein kinase
VAIKEFRSAEPFNKEKDILEKIQNLHHKHLIEHLAICENGTRYYLIFPWADGGNLREFWEREDSRERTPELALWSLQQMLGLAGALKALHSVNCRHGDLKPENILRFKEGGNGTLVVADVGVSRVHDKGTEFRHAGTTTRATTPSYEPPEVYLQPNTPHARRYDLWSIGCIFLEFNIWLLYGFEAINSFGYGRDAPEFGFYKLNSDRTAAETHNVVSKAIDTLRQDPQCRGGTALETLVNLIAEHLLQVDVDRGYRATELYDELHKIVQDAEMTRSCLFNKVNPRPDIPRIFQRRG